MRGFFKLGVSAANAEFFELVHVGIDVYISHCKYKENTHLCSWFSAGYVAAIANRNHFHHLYISKE